MINVIKHTKASRIYLSPPLHNSHKDACLSYHIKGLYNARCVRSKDHHTYRLRGLGADGVVQEGHPWSERQWRWGRMMPLIRAENWERRKHKRWRRGIPPPPLTNKNITHKDAADPG